MEQTNKDKLKFKIARGVNALSNETIEFRKEAIIELFRVFDTDKYLTEEKATDILMNRHDAKGYLMSAFTWNRYTTNGNTYWVNIYNKL